MATRRLFFRGIKILLIFSVLNLLIQASGLGNVDKVQIGIPGFLRQAREIYWGGDGSAASFVILLPIAYLLLIAPGLLYVSRGPRFRSAVILIFAGAMAAFPSITDTSAVVEFMLVGVSGFALGQVASPVELNVSHCTVRRLLGWFLLIGCVWLTGQLRFNVAAYTIGVVLVVGALYEVGAAADPAGMFRRGLVLLGRYSLFGYIGQIVVIQLLFRVLGQHRWTVGPQIGGLVVATVVVLIGSCLLLERLRARSAAIDKVYRVVFS